MALTTGEQLRSLAKAQRIIDEFRERQDARVFLKQQLVEKMELVLRTNKIVSEAATDCAAAVHALPAVDENPLQT